MKFNLPVKTLLLIQGLLVLLSLPIENSLLANLDAQEIFRAGETDMGTVYLVGGDMGVEGRLSAIDDGMLIIYSGFCSVGFG